MTPNPRHYSIIIQWSHSAQAYIVTVPKLPACKAYGETREKAVVKALDTIEGWLKVAQQAGWPVPLPDIITA